MDPYQARKAAEAARHQAMQPELVAWGDAWINLRLHNGDTLLVRLDDIRRIAYDKVTDTVTAYIKVEEKELDFLLADEMGMYIASLQALKRPVAVPAERETQPIIQAATFVPEGGA